MSHAKNVGKEVKSLSGADLFRFFYEKNISSGGSIVLRQQLLESRTTYQPCSGRQTAQDHSQGQSVWRNSNRWLPESMGTDLTISDFYDANGNIKALEQAAAITWNYRDNLSSAVLLKRDAPTGGGELINDAEYKVIPD